MMTAPDAKQQLCWFVMRDLKRTNAKQPAYRLLAEKDFEVFTPMEFRLRVCDGKRTRVEVPVIHDLLFVHSTQEELDPITEDCPTLQYRFLKGGYRLPMTVCEAEMQRFIRAVKASDQPKYFLPGELTPAMYGRSIRIVGGPLDGYEGRLLSLRGSKKKRLIVELPGLLSVGAEVEPEYITLL